MASLFCVFCRFCRGRRHSDAGKSVNRNIQQGKSQTNSNRAHANQSALNAQPTLTNHNTNSTSAHSTRSSTSNLPYTGLSLQSKPSPEYPDAVSDPVVKLVWRLQRKVISYVDARVAENDHERSFARTKIYGPVIRLARSSPQYADEYKHVAKQIEDDLIKPLTPSLRTNSDLVHICEIGREINCVMKREGGDYAFGVLHSDQPPGGRIKEFPELTKDGKQLLEEVEFGDCNPGTLEGVEPPERT